MQNQIIQKTNFFLVTLFLAFTLSSCQSSLFQKNADNSKKDPSKVIIATYEGGEVTLEDAENEFKKLIAKSEKLEGLEFEKLNSEQKEVIVKEVVFNKLAYKEAKKRRLNKEKDYKKAVKLFKSELLKQKLLIALAKDSKSDLKIKESYDKLVKKLKNKKDLRISYIIVKKEKDANYIYKKLLKKPRLFAYYAKNKSIDKATAKKGGNLGFIFEDALPQAISNQTKILNKGEISEPISASDKWIIVKLTDERPAQILDFEDAKEGIAKNLAQKAIKDFISQTLQKAQISIIVK